MRCRTFRTDGWLDAEVVDSVRLRVQDTDHFYLLTGELLDASLGFQTINFVAGAKDPLAASPHASFGA